MDPTSGTVKGDLTFVSASAGGDAVFDHPLEASPPQEAMFSPRGPDLEKQTSPAPPKSEIAMNVLQRTMKGKEKEWSSVAEKKRPLQLLDLPVDILREIIGQVRSCSFRLVEVF
jgi:hypothetical protein